MWGIRSWTAAASANWHMRRIASSSPHAGRPSDQAAVSCRPAAMNGFWCSSMISMFSQCTMATPPGTSFTRWNIE